MCPEYVFAVNDAPGRDGTYSVGRFKIRPSGAYSLFDFYPKGNGRCDGSREDVILKKTFSCAAEAVIAGASAGIEIAKLDSDMFFNYMEPEQLMAGVVKWEDFKWA